MGEGVGQGVSCVGDGVRCQLAFIDEQKNSLRVDRAERVDIPST